MKEEIIYYIVLVALAALLIYTIIKGIDQKEIDLDKLVKSLKSKFACGGTIKAGKIELQGNHKQKVRDALIAQGFAPETIIAK